MRFLSLFAGIGGFDLGLERAGMECAGQVEIDKFCRRVLEYHWPNVKRIGDIREVRGGEFGSIELVCGGFPCQPFSCAGKRKGKEDDRYLWPEMLRVIETYRPTWVLGENVAGIIGVELDKVLSDLEGIGYKIAPPFVIPACAVDAPHRRDRVWIIAHAKGDGLEVRRLAQCGSPGQFTWGGKIRDVADTESAGLERWHMSERKPLQPRPGQSGRPESCQWEPEPDVGRLAYGIPNRVAQLRALGNAVVPQVVEEIGKTIMYVNTLYSQPKGTL